MKKKIIYMMGPMGCGKGTAARYLEEKDYSIFSLSEVVKEKTREAGLSLTRENMRAVGEGLKEIFGDDYLAKVLIERIKKDPRRNIVIDGPRCRAEVECIREEFSDVLLIYIEVDELLRKERIIQRGRLGDPTNLSELEVIMEKDINTTEPCKKLEGVVVLSNNETLEKFQNHLTEILQIRSLEEVLLTEVIPSC